MFQRALVCVTILTLAGCGGSGAPPPDEPSEEATAMPEHPEAASPEEEASSPDIEGALPVVEMKTSLGTIRVELYPEKAPQTVENFLAYAREGFYDGTIFHRVIEGFMIQGGGFTAEMTEKGTRSPIENEADNGLKNERGTIAMARTMEPHSASSQFFINSKDNPPLDHSDKSVRGWGYAVFGRVVEGLQVIDAIEGVATTNRSGHQDVPVEPVIIESVRLLN